MLKDFSSHVCRSLFVAFGILAVCLPLQIINGADNYELDTKLGQRLGIVTGPAEFVPTSLQHLPREHGAGTACYLFGFLAAYQGKSESRCVCVALSLKPRTRFEAWRLLKRRASVFAAYKATSDGATV